jgi:hypothetical protein
MQVPQHRKTSITAGFYIHLLGNVIKRVDVNDGVKDRIVTQQPPAGNIVMKHNPAPRTCSQIYGNLMLGHSIHELMLENFIIPTHDIYVSCSQIPDLSAVTPDEEDNSYHKENNKDVKKSGNKPTHQHVKKLGNNIINK